MFAVERWRPRASGRRPASAFVVLALGAAVGCRSDGPPGPLTPDPALIGVAFVCGRRFDLTNANPDAVVVDYDVSGNAETGRLRLAARSAPGRASRTRLVLLGDGTLRVRLDGALAAEAAGDGAGCSPVTRTEPGASVGRWSAPFPWPAVAVHLHLLPTGKVLSWGRQGDPALWDPATGSFTPAPAATDVFCAGHAFLPDGRLLVAGGHLGDNHGLPATNLFDPAAGGWTALPPMARGRWYPTTTTLSDGRVVVLGGTDEQGAEVDVPELWTGSAWSALPGAARVLPYYPRMFVAPNGLVFYAGELQESAYLDPAGGGRWIPVARSRYGRRDYGSAVMYAPGKVLIVGGSDPADGPPTATAETIDLNQASPAWSWTGAMAHPRRHLNATVLPDGRVIATGGTSAAGFSDPTGAVHAAEVWSPTTGAWTAWAANAVTRVYHSTTLLLPDGRVLHAGSGDGSNLPRETSAEIFTPPYLFLGPRPVIANAPTTIGYGAEVTIETPEPGVVTRVTLVRLSAVTHAFDQNQRFLELRLHREDGGLSVSAPAVGSVAPPGHYMLFLLDSDGVPSIARIVRLN